MDWSLKDAEDLCLSNTMKTLLTVFIFLGKMICVLPDSLPTGASLKAFTMRNQDNISFPAKCSRKLSDVGMFLCIMNCCSCYIVLTDAGIVSYFFRHVLLHLSFACSLEMLF